MADAKARLAESNARAIQAHPLPWKVGYEERGLGHKTYGIMDANGKTVLQPFSADDPTLAYFIVNAVNARHGEGLKSPKNRGKNKLRLKERKSHGKI